MISQQHLKSFYAALSVIVPYSCKPRLEPLLGLGVSAGCKYSDPICSPFVGQVLHFLQETKAVFALLSWPEILLAGDDRELTKLVFPCTWILARWGKNLCGWIALDLRGSMPAPEVALSSICISTTVDICAEENKHIYIIKKKGPALLFVHSALLGNNT